MDERSPHHRTALDMLGYPLPIAFEKRNPTGTEDHVIYWNAFVWDERGAYCWGGGDLDLS